MKTILKEKLIPHVKNLILFLRPHNLEPREGNTSTRTSGRDLNIPPFQGGGCHKAYNSLGRRLVNLLPVALRTNASTYSKGHTKQYGQQG